MTVFFSCAFLNSLHVQGGHVQAIILDNGKRSRAMQARSTGVKKKTCVEITTYCDAKPKYTGLACRGWNSE